MRQPREVLRAGMAGEEVAELHAALARLGFAIPETERQHDIFGVMTAQAVAAFQKAHGLLDTAVVDRHTAAAIIRALADVRHVPVEVQQETMVLREPPAPAKAEAPKPEPPKPEPTPAPAPTSETRAAITGRAYFEYGGPAADVLLRAYRRGFGGATRPFGQASTGPDGRYRIEYDGAGPVNLELRAVQPGGAEVSLTLTAFAVDDGDVLNLVVPASVRPQRGEYERLTDDLQPHLLGGRLGAARQTAEQPDLTLLQESTGWDARLVALAATAERLTAATGVPAPAVYALLRAGLPDTPSGLAGVGAATIDRVLKQAAAAGVVDLDEAGRKAANAAFASFARTARLAAVAPGALSSQAEMLATAGLSTADASRFDGLYTENAMRGGDSAALWRDAEAAGLPVAALRLTGKLGFLTLNNATLTAAVTKRLSNGLGPSLVADGLYRPDAWGRLLTETAGGDQAALAALIPPAFRNGTVEAGLRSYAEDLARKVRTGFRTNVIGRLVATGDMPLPQVDTAVRADTARFLDRAAELDLQLGRASVTAMLREHGDRLLAGVPADRVTPVTDSVRTLHRLYQITPSDRAMQVLLSSGFRSAHDVTRLPYDKFLRHHGAKFDSTDEARLVYRRAQQIASVAQTIVTAAKQLDAAPPLYALSGPQSSRETAKTALVQQFPTMEQLFGSLDYCACDHCRSVLSPAAYLVDLLHFLDPAAQDWQTDLALWRADHGGAPYPFTDVQAWQDAGSPQPQTPYEVLTGRRPDLPRLPLTCENTNTVMPYVDIVNEILEFFVAHGRLGPAAVRDTGDALSADLLAEPQYVITEAYETLRKASYPLTLPFDLWLETVRRLLDHFDTPLWTVLEAFGRTGPVAEIERLGLSPAEYAVLTDPDPVPRWHQRYGYPIPGAAQAELSNAKQLARRLGVTYQELLELVTSGFVNPELARVAALPKLGLGIADVLRYQGAPGHAPYTADERAAFEEALAPIGGPAALGDLLDPAALRRMLVLADPDANCGFETTVLQYADGRPADPIAFLTLNYLVRIWRRLGWSIAETDLALRVFLPSVPDPRTAAGLGPAMAVALLGLARLEAVRAALPVTRTGLLALWSDVTATRYAELFLVPGTPEIDPVFDQPLGRYLEFLDGDRYRPYTWDPALPESPATGNVGLVNHAGTVQAALQLSADDVTRILVDAGTTLEAAPLDLATVSLLHRYGVLARALRLPVADLIALRQIAGADLFAEDAAGTLDFVEAAAALDAAGLSVTELDYLLRHRYDPAGTYATGAAPPLPLVRTLDAEIARIRTEHADPYDATALTDDELRQKMALVQPADVVERFFGMWTGTITYDAVTTGVDPADALDPAAVAGEPAVTLLYDPVRAEQHLIYRGVLVAAERARLVAAHPGPAAATSAYAALLDSVRQTAREFFDLNLLAPVGFLDASDFDLFFSPPPAGADEVTLQANLAARRERLVAVFLPYLRDRLIDQTVLSTVEAEYPDSTELAASLATDVALLADRQWPGEPLLLSYRAAGDRGLTVTADTAAQTAGVDTYLEVPATGGYRFFVACERAGTVVDLRFDHLTDALVLATTANDGEELSGYADLSAGTTYHLRLDATATGGGAVTVLVQATNLPKGPVDRLTCHPADAVERVRRAHVLLAKAVRLAAVAELSEPELRHLLTHPDDFAGLSLGALPVTADEDGPVQATVLFGQLRRVLGHAALRRDLGAAPGELTDLYAHARQEYPAELGEPVARDALLADLYARIALLTRRDEATVAEAVDRLGMTAAARPAGDVIQAAMPALANEIGLGRLWTVLALAGRLGVTPGTLATIATPTPGEAVARQLRDAVRAYHDVASWRRVAQPIFDKLRQQRRDALVAWVLHATGYERVEQLFEHFLVDPATEPVVQTSRLRLAISAVQLFIQRCLLNLEPEVHPSAINAAHWQWMKRYRVWEANRKIFLWPENWLEPEFRDDKTHLFKALESSLFAGDLTDDLAEEAFAGYLRALEPLARLDIRSTYLEEKDDPGSNTLHVVGRTFAAPYRYFYRTYTYGVWTPWVPVTAEIEGDHLAVAVWQQRPHLFWVTFLDKPQPSTESRTPTELADVAIADQVTPLLVEVRLHWTEYHQGEWTDRVSDGLPEPMIALVGTIWNPALERIHVTHDEDAVLVHVFGNVDQTYRLESKHNPPSFDEILAPPASPYVVYPLPQQRPGMPELTVPFSVMYDERVTTGGLTSQEPPTIAAILRQSPPFTLRQLGNPPTTVDAEVGALISPLFLKDRRHTFYVEPALTETTVADWDDWVIPPITFRPDLLEDAHWDLFDLASQLPATGDAEITAIASVSRYQVAERADWLTRPGNTVTYDGSVVTGRQLDGLNGKGI